MQYSVRGGETFELDTIVLDLNGTLSVGAKVVPGVAKRLKALRKAGFKIILFTGDVRGTAEKICGKLGIDYVACLGGAEKTVEMKKLDGSRCAAIGNARIDIGTFKQAKVAVLTLQGEGIHPECIKHVDVIVPSINDALDLFLYPDNLTGTLRE